MSYIGNTSQTQAFTPAVDYFSGNASTTAFTLSRPVASVAQVQVTIDNVAQNPSSAFTVSGSTITFTSAPLSGTNNIYVYYTSPITQVIAPSQGTVTTTSFASSTGSGAVVLATSPTLVTPALGTPSALVLTNATGLPLTTGVTGTLPVANGGTGRTTTLAECSAILTADSSTFSNGTNTKCSFTTATFDNKSGFASGGYTIPTAGVYTMTTTIRFRQASGGIANQYLVYWYKNGSELTRTEIDGAAGSVQFYGITITAAWNGSFALNDVITVYGYVSTGSGANTYYFVNNACTFNIRQLS